MRDYFGQDAPEQDGTPVAAPANTTPPIPAATPATGPGGAPAVAPTLQQFVDKAVAKSAADTVVATDPHAVHSVKLGAAAPTVLGSTAAGAGIGMLIGGPPGALAGAGIGWVTERYHIGGGFFGKGWNKLRAHLHWRQKQAAAVAAATAAGATPAAATAAGATAGAPAATPAAGS